MNYNLPLYTPPYQPFNLSPSNCRNRIDLEYLNTLNPRELAELKYIIEQECDKMDYDGSMMYDECPDKVMFMKKCNDICSVANCNCDYAKKCPDKAWLKDMVNVLLTNEMYRRRCMRRNMFR